MALVTLVRSPVGEDHDPRDVGTVMTPISTSEGSVLANSRTAVLAHPAVAPSLSR